MLLCLVSLVWDWRMGMFQLSGFYCKCQDRLVLFNLLERKTYKSQIPWIQIPWIPVGAPLNGALNRLVSSLFEGPQKRTTLCQQCRKSPRRRVEPEGLDSRFVGFSTKTCEIVSSDSSLAGPAAYKTDSLFGEGILQQLLSIIKESRCRFD